MKKSLLLALLISISQFLLADNPKENWIFRTNGRIYSTPAISGNIVLFGSGDSCFYGVSRPMARYILMLQSMAVQ